MLNILQFDLCFIIDGLIDIDYDWLWIFCIILIYRILIKLQEIFSEQ